MNNIVITAANSKYYHSLLTLINSIHLYSLELVQSIIVYNLGLSGEEVKNLKKIKNVIVEEFPQGVELLHSKFLEPKQYVYKIYCAKNSEKFGKNILWLDAGVMALKPLDEIFKVIENEHIFMVGDVHLNKNYTHKNCIKIMNATEKELNDTQISAGILGYKSDGKFNFLIEEAYNYSLIENCVDGSVENHRHDQSVYSILASRYNVKKYNIDKYGYWTDSNRNLKTAIENNAVIFVHRNGHYDVKNLIYVT